MALSTGRSWCIVGFVLLAASTAGGLLGDRVRADGQAADEKVAEFGRVLAIVEDRFVGDTEPGELVEDAVAGMLRTLDPHSNYLPPEAFTEMRDEQRGKFHGLGIQITKRGADKPLTIIAPIDDTPAARAGLQSGDIISRIEGESTTEMTVQDAVRRLKGDRGTEVTITIERPGTEASFDVTIERDEIPIESIRLSYLIRPGVGFVRISNFTSTTASELDRALGRLAKEGMNRLILDLRGNPGGLLDQAVEVTERFLPPGKQIVYTRGRISGSDQDFRAKRGVERMTLPLVVLLDHSSASASEIVSGALQDHDRALVVGETSFGKGLVQRVIPLRGGGALAVTTAKYYTPAGRLIQRDYSDFEEYYLGTEDEDAGAPEAVVPGVPEPELPPDPREVFFTASGRKVYGGGGIRPDHLVKGDRSPLALTRLLRENLIFDFSVLYSGKHPDLELGFAADDGLWGEFTAFVQGRAAEVSAAELTENRAAIALRLRAQIARVKWNQIEEARILAEADPQVQRALELFPEAARLAGIEEPPALRAEAAAGEPSSAR